MAGFLQTVDENILFFIQAHMKSPALDQAMVFITSLGNAGLLWITIAFIILFNKKYQKCGIGMFLAIFLSNYLGENILKPFFGRVRPCNIFMEIPLLIEAPHSPSFPSGHTMVGFASATILFYFNRKLGLAGYCIAAMIGFSRLYLFVHYPTDILGGIIFGVLCAFLVLYGLKDSFQW
jgi:undecaprenyl-diphosphatase